MLHGATGEPARVDVYVKPTPIPSDWRTNNAHVFRGVSYLEPTGSVNVPVLSGAERLYTFIVTQVGTGLIGAYARDGEPIGEFFSENGTFEITSSSSTQLVGSLTFDGIGALDSAPENEVSITVVAEFDARCVQTGGSACF